MRLLTLLGLLLTVTGSTLSYAQDEDLSRYYPLDVGDKWVYGNYEWDCFEKDCDLERVYVRREVVEEIVIREETYAAVEVSVLDADRGTVLCTSAYGARVNAFVLDGEPEAVVDIVEIEPPCNDAFLEVTGDQHLEEMRSLANGAPSMQSVYIGGLTYNLMVRRDSFDPDLREVDLTFARDVGLVQIDWFRDIGPGFSEYGSFSLEYAEVGGDVYGARPVTAEPGVPASSPTAVTLYPNPTRGPVTIQSVRTGARPATVEVFDVLGRLVLSRDLGPQPDAVEHRLDLTDVPAGVYIVRILDGSDSTTKQLVKVE